MKKLPSLKGNKKASIPLRSALKACVVIPYPHIESNELDSFPGTESYPFLDSATNASIS